MKTLSQLEEILTAIPYPFAQKAEASEKTGADTGTDNLPESGDTANFEDGFPHQYSENPSTTGLYLLRKDMNRIGEMSTRELMFKQVGMSHTYNANVAAKSAGYPRLSMLEYDDNICIKKVESQTVANDVDFNDNPAVIDAYTSSGSSGRAIYWKTVNRIYGIEEDLLHVTVDFSRQVATEFSRTPSLTISDDALITVSGFSGEEDTVSDAKTLSITITNPNNNNPTTIAVPNIGKTGMEQSAWPVILVNRVWMAPFFLSLNGYAGYYVSFFAKANSKISVSLSEGATASSLWAMQISASPILFKIINLEEKE